MSEQDTHRRRGRIFAAAGIAVVASVIGMTMLVVTTSRAAFVATTQNGANNFAAGTVAIGNDGAGSVLFNLTGMKPGDTSAKCINVIYTGSLPANVHLYGTVAGTGLATYLDFTVSIGTGATGGAGLSCTGFTPQSNIFTGTLASFGAAHTNYANGAGGFDGAVNPATRSYQVTVTLQDNNAAQGLTASTNLTWEAQNT